MRAETEETIHLENQLCICELNLKLNKEEAYGTKLTITDGSHTYAIVPSDPDGVDKFTVALIPVSGQNFEFTVSTGKKNLKYSYYKELSEILSSETEALGKFVTADGKVWTREGEEAIEYFRKSNGVTLFRNKYYKLDLNVHNVGTVYPIGIIAWLGNDAELSCGKNHGLVMSVKEELTGKEWAREGYGDSNSESSIFTSGNIESISDCETKYVNGATYSDFLSQTHGTHVHPLFEGIKTYRTGSNAITIPNTENWFVPSIAQWLAVLGNNGIGKFTGTWNWADAFTGASTSVYTNLNDALSNSYKIRDLVYWTSTQATGKRAVTVTLSASEGVKIYTKLKYEYDNTTIRPFFAF